MRPAASCVRRRTAGSTDHFRLMDRTTRTLAPEHQAARLAARTAYLDAVRDWVLTGQHALAADAARRHLPRITPEIALAQAHFRLGVWLRRHGNAAEGDAHLAEASRLHPEFVEHLAPGGRSRRGRQGERRGDSGSASRRSAIGRTIRLRGCEAASNKEGVNDNERHHIRRLDPGAVRPAPRAGAVRAVRGRQGSPVRRASAKARSWKPRQARASSRSNWRPRCPQAVRIVATDLNQPMLDHARASPAWSAWSSARLMLWRCRPPMVSSMLSRASSG